MEYLEFYVGEIKTYKTSTSKRSYLTRERNRLADKRGELMKVYISTKDYSIGQEINEVIDKSMSIDYLYTSI